jgi:hypothetical protein
LSALVHGAPGSEPWDGKEHQVPDDLVGVEGAHHEPGALGEQLQCLALDACLLLQTGLIDGHGALVGDHLEQR